MTVGTWYERREAARFALYRWDEYMRLSGDDQSAVIAHYRMHNRIEAIVADYQEQQSKRRVK